MSMDIYTPNDTDVIHSTKVDFRKRTIRETIHVVQFDKSLPVIAVALMYNGYSYTAPNNSEIWVRWGKKDHTYVYKKCMISSDRKTVYFEVDYQMTVIHGDLNPILELIIGEKSAGSSSIPIVIDRNPIQDSDIESRVEDSTVAELRGEDLRLYQEIAGVDSRKQDKLTFDDTPRMGSSNPVTSEGIKMAIADSQARGIYNYKGQVPSYSDLPTSGRAIGDVWEATDTGINWAWNGSSWDNKGTGFKAQLNLVLTQRGYKHATDSDDGRELEVEKALEADKATEADLANNLNATKGLTVNDDPMSFGAVGGAQKSAVGDGNASLNKLTCVDVVRNQLINAANYSTTAISGVTITKNADGTLTLNGTAENDIVYDLNSVISVADNVNHCFLWGISEVGGHNYYIRDNYTFWNTGSVVIIKFTQSTTNMFQSVLVIPSGTVCSNELVTPRLIDLTQRYGSNDVVNAIIGTGESDEQVERLLAFDPEILNDTAFDAGTLVPSKSAKLVSNGKDGNVLGTITLPNHEGHGILKVVNGKVVADGDELYPDGKGKKRYGISVFDGSADEDWKDYGSAQRFKIGIRNAMPSSNPGVIEGIACDRLTATSKSNVYLSNYQISRGDENDLNIIVRINSSTDDVAKLKAWLASNPITVVYELATEQDISTPVYQSTFPVEQGGTLQFLDEGDKPIAGLQGSEVFYQKNIKAFVEALGEATDWNPERIKRLGSKEALGGTLRQLLAATKNIDFINTAYVDLGTLDYYLSGSSMLNLFSTPIPNIATGGDDQVQNILCSSLVATCANNNKMNTIAVRSDGKIKINTTETDTNAFKASMQGVLLAYEKASS